MHRAALRLSYSQILRFRRCPWAWHARHVRKLIPISRKRPPPVWGDAYHAAAAAVWRQRASLERSGRWLDGRDPAETGYLDALVRLRELDVAGVDAEALAAEVAQAACEACRFVGPEWRVLWLDGSPVVEASLVVRLGETQRRCDRCGGTGEGDPDARVGYDLGYDLCPECEGGRQDVPVDLLCVLDLALVHVETGVVRVVDHKSTTSWPEQVGDALRPDEDLDLDLRDDLQVRLYVLALRDALQKQLCAAREEADCGARFGNDSQAARASAHHFGAAVLARRPIEGYHLVRRASAGSEPPLVKGGRLSRAAEHEATVEQWMAALARHHLRPDDYEPQLAQARLRRWQAWAPCQFTAQSLELARKEALQAAEEMARLGALDPDDVPRFRLPGRWMLWRPGRWGGSAPKSQAECFAWSACAACDHRELCVAEGQGDKAATALLLAGEYAHPEDARDLAVGELPPCELDADEVE